MHSRRLTSVEWLDPTFSRSRAFRLSEHRSQTLGRFAVGAPEIYRCGEPLRRYFYTPLRETPPCRSG
jgi:hypothetical protein